MKKFALFVLMLGLLATSACATDPCTQLKKENARLKTENNRLNLINKSYGDSLDGFQLYGDRVGQYLYECQHPPKSEKCKRLYDKIVETTPQGDIE